MSDISALDEIRGLALRAIQPAREEKRKKLEQFNREQKAEQSAAECDLPKWIEVIRAALTDNKQSVTNADWPGHRGGPFYVGALQRLLGDPFGVRNHAGGFLGAECYTEVYWKE